MDVNITGSSGVSTQMQDNKMLELPQEVPSPEQITVTLIGRLVPIPTSESRYNYLSVEKSENHMDCHFNFCALVVRLVEHAYMAFSPTVKTIVEKSFDANKNTVMIC